MSAAESLPVPRFGRSTSRAPEADIGRALAEHGVVVVAAEGLDEESVERAAAASRRAFALPDDRKASLQGPIDGSQRGYLPLRTILPSGRQALDRKEAWHARAEGHPTENLFPEEVPEFGRSLLALIEGLEATSLRLLRGIEAFLGRAGGYLEAQVQAGDSLLRVNHYPKRSSGEDDQPFLPHEDFDLITLLFGASEPGLEVQDRSGVWRPVASSMGDAIVTVGCLLEAESEGAILATRHRVVSPADSDSGRLSMVYFVSPRPEVILSGGRSAGEIVDQHLREAGYA